MNSIPTFRHAVVALVLVLGAAALPAPLHASGAPAPAIRLPLAGNTAHTPPVHAHPPILVGGVLQDVISNRTRLIQASFIAVIVGILILWKK